MHNRRCFVRSRFRLRGCIPTRSLVRSLGNQFALLVLQEIVGDRHIEPRFFLCLRLFDGLERRLELKRLVAFKVKAVQVVCWDLFICGRAVGRACRPSCAGLFRESVVYRRFLQRPGSAYFTPSRDPSLTSFRTRAEEMPSISALWETGSMADT